MAYNSLSLIGLNIWERFAARGHEVDTEGPLDFNLRLHCDSCGRSWLNVVDFPRCDKGIGKARQELKRQEQRDMRISISAIKNRWWENLTDEERNTEIALHKLMQP